MKPQAMLRGLRHSNVLPCLAVAAACLAAPAAGQEEIKSLAITWGGGNRVYVWTPDLDGDGHWDLILGDAAYDVGPGSTNEGRVFVLSGRTGTKIYEYFGTMTTDLLGFSVAALGRVDADSTPDFGAAGRESFVWSGADGSELYSESLQFGSTIAPLGDLNADGFDDFALAIVVPFVRSDVRVVYGGSFVSPFTIQPPSDLWKLFGWAIEAMDDVDGDGVPDLAVSAPGAGAPLDCSQGYVGVFSGSDGHLIHFREGGGQGDRFGASLAATGDLNGDGVGDLVVGSPLCCGSCFGGGGKGRLYFLDGRTGATIEALWPPPFKLNYGSVVSAAGDVNGNGVPDVYVYSTSPNIDLLDGATRNVIYTLPYTPSKPTGAPLGVGDLNGDEFPDFFVQYGLTGVGSFIGLYSGAPIGVETFGSACGGAALGPRIGTGSPHIGTNHDINLSLVEPGLNAFLAVGFSRTSWMGVGLPFDLGGIGMTGCDLLVSPDAVFAVQTQQVTPGQGAATVVNAIPQDPGLIGITVYAQWLVLNPPGSPTRGFTSRGLAITFR